MTDHTESGNREATVDARIAEIEARANAATSGPWVFQAKDGGRQATFLRTHFEVGVDKGLGVALAFGDTNANAAFIAYAREDIPFLIAALRPSSPPDAPSVARERFEKALDDLEIAVVLKPKGLWLRRGGELCRADSPDNQRTDAARETVLRLYDEAASRSPRVCERCGKRPTVGVFCDECWTEMFPNRRSLAPPTLASLWGTCPDLTGGLSSEEFVRRQRGAPDFLRVLADGPADIEPSDREYLRWIADYIERLKDALVVTRYLKEREEK